MHTDSAKAVYLSLGSNVGDRARNIARAVEALNAAGVRVVKHSSLYRTEPVDAPPQAWFLNCALQAETELMPQQLLRVVREVERKLGRQRMVARGPRTIDIDILLYGSSRISSPDLEVPHPRMATRRFVLVPLAEIAPTLRHPALGCTISELLAAASGQGRVTRWHLQPRIEKEHEK